MNNSTDREWCVQKGKKKIKRPNNIKYRQYGTGTAMWWSPARHEKKGHKKGNAKNQRSSLIKILINANQWKIPQNWLLRHWPT